MTEFSNPTPERERLRRALGPHHSRRLPRPDPHPRAPPPPARAPRLPPPLQQAQAASCAAAPAARRRRSSAAEHRPLSTPPRPAGRTHPRIRGRLSLRTLRADSRSARSLALPNALEQTAPTTAKLLDRPVCEPYAPSGGRA